MSIINNNSYNKLVNFPFFLLSYIIRCIDDNIDRICWSLVCKRWFEQRDKYLIFNSDTLNIDSHHINFYLKSFKSIYIKSLELKNNCNLFIGSKYNVRPQIDYFIDGNSLESYKSIQSNVDRVILDSTPGVPANFNVDRDLPIDSEYLAKLLQDSNVTRLDDCRTLKHSLPTRLKSLSFYGDFNEKLYKGCLPAGLKELNGLNVDQRIENGLFPEGLEKLELGYSYSEPIEPGVLPVSLKHISFQNHHKYKQELSHGVLPPSLESLEFSGVPLPIDSRVLPHTLHTLYVAPTQWISIIKTLPNLRNLSFYDTAIRNNNIRNDATLEETIDLSELPKTLVRLRFHSKFRLTSTLPQSIRYLGIDKCIYDIEELFEKDTIHYQLEELKVGWFPAVDSKQHQVFSQLKIRKLSLVSIDQQFVAAGQIPVGIESLDLSMAYDIELEQGSIPQSVKYLRLDHIDGLVRPGYIPESVEQLELINNFYMDNEFQPGTIPNTMRTLILYFSPNLLQSIPKSLTNIIFRALPKWHHACHVRNTTISRIVFY
ncbi:hypothetical protein PPL_02788 [Heterostelium album PN500]|uniref:F-box domain-containing protein n=1 Tax=Heterostelium pallidum (strain ATCC 26659 / Pp 5 / PN500) TaxID=670386 RepID=D3B323_HETP5|nr:hypothetical protein PPL_02788 [Heterostelium album PN500]EFA83721.1 hypothetical protein PPL_02788 [Heterostelium album PN500]|eukprot:XP_020435838.1 hypothetical protein PPL_02788 [Heterostelium album PN500]